MHRRRFLQTGALAAAAPALMPGAPAHSEQTPDMLLAYLSQRLNKLAAKWDEERARIHTAADVEARNRFVPFSWPPNMIVRHRPANPKPYFERSKPV